MSDWFVGRRITIEEPLGREVRRWRVQHTRKRLRLIDRGECWAVLAQINLAEMRIYPAKEQAQDVCERLMKADGERWYEVQLPAQWWA